MTSVAHWWDSWGGVGLRKDTRRLGSFSQGNHTRTRCETIYAGIEMKVNTLCCRFLGVFAHILTNRMRPPFVINGDCECEPGKKCCSVNLPKRILSWAAFLSPVAGCHVLRRNAPCSLVDAPQQGTRPQLSDTSIRFTVLCICSGCKCE